MDGGSHDGRNEKSSLPEDHFELEVIANKPDPRMGERELLETLDE